MNFIMNVFGVDSNSYQKIDSKDEDGSEDNHKRPANQDVRNQDSSGSIRSP